jgi:very-short-patch-repair endonuclease
VALAQAPLDGICDPPLIARADSLEHKVGRYIVDFALPTIGVALECDGWYHTTEKGKQHDAKKDAALATEGWHVIRIADALIRKDARSIVLSVLGDHI